MKFSTPYNCKAIVYNSTSFYFLNFLKNMIHIPAIHTLHYQSKREFWHWLEYGHGSGSPSWPTSEHFSQTFTAEAWSFPFPKSLVLCWKHSHTTGIPVCSRLKTEPTHFPQDYAKRCLFSSLKLLLSLVQPREITWGSHVSVTLAWKISQYAQANLIL